METKMNLTEEQKKILEGSQGEEMAKILKSLVWFGEIFGAEKLVPITHKEGHLVTSFGISLLKPLFKMMDELIAAGIKTKASFTVDPRPIDYENVKANLLQKLVFSKIMYGKQAEYEEQLKAVGLKNDNAFTCTPYYAETGNTPKKGDIISWAESSAVVFANSVLGARCNRNSGVLELFGMISGYVPYFGFLTDEGRKATWKITVKTSKKPEAQILGSAIGMKVMEDVPYIVGLDKFLGTEINEDTIGYLKDFGAATASNGAVGLYHIDKLTPEAKELGEAGLLKEGYREYVIDDQELERVYASYPVMWKDKEAAPKLCFIGCPHLTFKQLNDWTDDISNGLKNAGKNKVALRTVLTSSPDVVEKFKKTSQYEKLLATGAKLTSICPLMFTNNPLTHSMAIITNSNKLRTYSMARYYKNSDILDIVIGK